MAISGYLETTASPIGKRDGARYKLRLQAQGADAAGTEMEILIHNISATGLLVESSSRLSVGEQIAISLPHSGVTTARVIWTSGSLHGCQFAVPVSAATLSAAQLRSVVINGAGEGDESHARPDESFGDRLQRLRTERGITQAQLAEFLNISEPSISAWEQDKSRPKAGRMEALAHFLAVPIAELLGHADKGRLPGLIAKAKRDIAESIGASPNAVKITIEF
jgi:transcriptional regulator with XRE-family HTH domain